jgi:hypothetical protein
MTTYHVLVVVTSLLLVQQIVACWPVFRQLRPQQIKQSKKSSRRSAISRAPRKRPPCPGCQAAQKQPTKLPPPKIEQKRGRPREVDSNSHYCPNEGCTYHGWLGRGNIRANGHPDGGRWRQLHRTVCNKYFLETHGTIFCSRRVPVDTILLVLKSLAEGVAIR